MGGHKTLCICMFICRTWRSYPARFHARGHPSIPTCSFSSRRNLLQHTNSWQRKISQHQSENPNFSPLKAASIVSQLSRRNPAASTAMSSQFIGLTILLTLNDPSHTQLRGLVADVIGQELTLSNGSFLHFDRFLPNLWDPL